MIAIRREPTVFQFEDPDFNPEVHRQLNWGAIRRVSHKHELPRRERRRRIRFFLEGISRSKA
ncbi:MAG: hypothetical protein DRP71_15005 [Verrucomicrobia bacterium]|nr:MAG: hypothetical protein DRP71_15005 [Verrucomicrobiota bacterium]